MQLVTQSILSPVPSLNSTFIGMRLRMGKGISGLTFTRLVHCLLFHVTNKL